jgi:hypothetical protein
MRKSCLYCVTKHLGKAFVNLMESHQGYPEFMLLVIGNLAEAEDESLKDYPELSKEIRDHRKKLMDDYNYEVPFFEIYEKVRKLLKEGKDRTAQEIESWR